MHQSAAQYLRTVYFTLFNPIPAGTPLHDVDNHTIVLKGEDRAHDVFLKMEPFAEDEESEKSEDNNEDVEVYVFEEAKEEENREEEEDGKPHASKKARVNNGEEENDTAEANNNNKPMEGGDKGR
jgi:hypothetical protein